MCFGFELLDSGQGVSSDSSFHHFEGKFSVIKLSVSILFWTTGCRIYTVHREPIRLPEIQYPVFSI